MNSRIFASAGAAALHAALLLIPPAQSPPQAGMMTGPGPAVEIELFAPPSASPANPPVIQAAPPEPLLSPSPAVMPAALEPVVHKEPVQKPSDEAPPAMPDVPPQPPVPPARKPGAIARPSQSGGSGRPDLPAAPDYLRNTPPLYPAESRKAGEQGTVLLSVLVAEDGRPAGVQIQKGSGYARLDEAAVAAVKRWRFKPAVAGGRKVAARVEVPVRFRLK